MIQFKKAILNEIDYSTYARFRMNLTYPSSRYRSSNVLDVDELVGKFGTVAESGRR